MNLSNTEVVERFLKCQYEGDFDTAFGNFVSRDFVWVVGSAENEGLTAAIPWAGRRLEGKTGYIELVEQLFGEFEPLKFDPHRFTDVGFAVFVEGNFKFRHRATKKTADSDFVARFDMTDGRISGGQFFENTYSVAAARSPSMF
jgi:ketosteroid isomerase-like protein